MDSDCTHDVHSFGGTNRDGQLLRVRHSVHDNEVFEQVLYTYESLNRLATATAADNSWGESYVYDGFGNLYQKNPTHGAAPPLSVTVDPTTNRVNAPSLTYDANGNMTAPGGGLTGYSYDVENRMIAATNPNVLYAYGPSNQRVWKGNYTVSNGLWTLSSQEVYFYGVDGQKLGTYVIAANPVTIRTTDLRAYFGSKPIAYATSSTGVTLSNLAPFIADRLGSSRYDEVAHTRTSSYPYGEDKGTPGTNDEVKFATYTRDSATGLDYAMNRYYSNSLGRFMSADPYRANKGGPGDTSDPRSWNRYTYASGDPVNGIDPRGMLTCFYVDGELDSCEDDDVAFGPEPMQQSQPQQVSAGPLAQLRRQVDGAARRASDIVSKENCASLFFAKEHNTPENRQLLAKTLATTELDNGQIGVMSAANAAAAYIDPAIPAYTGDDNFIWVIQNGSFFTGTLNGKPLAGAFSGLSLPQVQDLIVIHEFMHQLGLIGEDNGKQTYTLANGQKVTGSTEISQAIRDNCFK